MSPVWVPRWKLDIGGCLERIASISQMLTFGVAESSLGGKINNFQDQVVKGNNVVFFCMIDGLPNGPDLYNFPFNHKP